MFFWPPPEAGNPRKTGSREAVAVYAAAAGALLIWAGTPIANKLAVVSIDAATAGMLRSVLAGPIALVVALALRLPFPTKRAQLILLLLSGITSFAIWPTLSEPTQIRIGILNQLTPEAINDIVGRFADAMIKLGIEVDKRAVLDDLNGYLASR